MSPFTLTATGQQCRGDFHTVSLHHACMVVAFCAFVPVKTDVLRSFPGLQFKKRKKKSVPVGDYTLAKEIALGRCLLACRRHLGQNRGPWTLRSLFTSQRSVKLVAVGRCSAGKEKTALGSVAVAGAVGSKWSEGGESCKHFSVY